MEKTEAEKCKSFAYFFENYVLITDSNGVQRKPDELLIKLAKELEENPVVYLRGRRTRTPIYQTLQEFQKFKQK